MGDHSRVWTDAQSVCGQVSIGKQTMAVVGPWVLLYFMCKHDSVGIYACTNALLWNVHGRALVYFHMHTYSHPLKIMHLT